MRKFDWSDLNVHQLQLLIAVAQTASVTAAATQLDLTQSAVSHQLDKLRCILDDPLFVKSGRGIVATARAQELATQAHELLGQIERFGRPSPFDPQRWRTTITIAANDFERDLLLPALAQGLRERAPLVSLRIIPADVPTAEMLRLEHCQLIITPRPPDASDCLQRRLFEDRYRVFFDPAARQPPRSRAEYLADDHMTVVYEPRRLLDIDQVLEQKGIKRRFTLMVPGFAALAPFLRASRLLATAPGRLQFQHLAGFASVPVPVPCPRLPMYLVWHLRYQRDPAHQWLRAQIDAVARPIASADKVPLAT